MSAALTVAALIRAYSTDPISPYHKLRHRTRINYEGMLRRVESEPIIANWLHLGHVRVSDLKARSFLKLHATWSQRGVPMAHGLMGMIRTVVGFGVTYLENADCERLAGVLHRMRFEMGSARDQALTADMAIAIRERAHREGMPMIALAQAIQFEGTFRQKDVVGEWVPTDEPGASEVKWKRYGEKWMRGICWNEIDDNLVLRHVTSKKQKIVEVDLKLAPMVVEELQISFCDLGEPLIEYDTKSNITAIHRNRLPATGPVIIDPDIGRPYRIHKFRKLWRGLARACGIPDAVQNRDSRAGAITEALASGASKDDVRKAATHSTSQMTDRYSREDAKATARSMKARAEGRRRNEQREVA